MSEKCKICGGLFYEEALSDDKCVICSSHYPDAKNMDDVLRSKPKRELVINLTEDRVKNLINDTLTATLGELGFSKKKCEKCSKEFWKRSPAQKQCQDCKATESTTKETA